MSIDSSRARGPGSINRTPPPARAGLLTAALALATMGSGQEAPSKTSSAPAAAPASRPADAGPTTPDASSPPSASEMAALRVELTDQIQAIAPSAASPAAAPRPNATPPAATDPAPAPESAADKSLRELLQERLRLLGEYDKASSAFKKASAPEPSPESQADEARVKLSRMQALLAQSAKSPEVLLPQAFRTGGAGPSVNAEMNAAIEAATAELKERKAKLEALRTEATGWEEHKDARRAERDRLFQEVVAMKAHAPERAQPAAGAGSSSSSSSSQRLAKERQVNAAWKSRVAAMQLQAMEAQIALETKLAAGRDLRIQAGQAAVRVAERTLELMQARYSAAAERQERLLKERAAVEESRASHSDDPMERYLARRHADLLDMEAQVVKHEQVLATSPPPSLEEQQALADRAANDFARVKALLDDGRVSRLDAIRLNNDFRRIGPERDRLLRNEQAPAEVRLQYYEDALTTVELELLRDSLQDRFELELLKERLPTSRWDECERVLADLERTHRELLVRRRKVLELLADATSRTLDQITRRLAILDEQYAFIRTHIFWVRDREPIGAATLTQGARECQHLLRALARLAQEAARPRNWGRPSAEFLAAALAALGLPIGLVRLRRLLRARLAGDLAAGGRGAS